MASTHRVTQADLARRAGVSRSCVSRVVRGLDKVTDDKRERVLAAARELGYIDNGFATALAGNRRSRLVGFLPQEISNAVFDDVYSGLKEVLEPEGYQFVIVEGSMDAVQEDARLRELAAFAPDCLVVAGYAGSTDGLTAAVHSIPIVSVTRRIEEEGVVSVYNDDHAGAAEATRYLIGLGHRRIAHLQLPPSIPYEDRAEGYLEAMRQASLEPWLITPGSHGQDSAYDAVASLLRESQAAGDMLSAMPTAVLCGSDHMALGALDALRDAGAVVPRDISVVGYDDQRAARLVGLTTVDQAAEEQGRIAARFVRSFLAVGDFETSRDAGGLEHRVLAPSLVVRETSGPPRD